jgi:branched-chain amino acid transport system substrate-binding protein
MMKAATSLNVTNDPFLLPGITVKTSATDHFPLDQAKLQRYHNGHWVSFGGLFRVR